VSGGGADRADRVRADPVAPATYASAGVDIAAGDRAVERIKQHVASTARPEVLGAIGGFGGCFSFEPGRFLHPVLVASTDGVGTKALVARDAGRFDTIGIDLVAMCVDDLVCVGAEPLFLLDYVVTGKLVPDQMEALVAGVADGCRRAGCALLGGEMAEHPGAMGPGVFDLAGFAVGAVERDAMLGADRVAVGDVLVGLASPGLRSNGYSLARHVLLERAALALDAPAWSGADHTLADALLEPSVVYAPAVLAAVAAAGVHAAAHITGGGLPGNLNRVLPAGGDAVLRRGSWDTPPIFTEIQRRGDIDDDEMARVFNLGLGMVLVVAPDAVDRVLAALDGAGQPATVVGTIVDGSGRVHIRDGGS
jgi:phosphoribosylformylglycinamidine cyclo-ligase